MLIRTSAVLLWLASAILCRAQSPPELDLLLDFDVRPSAVFLRSMEQEVDTILSPADLRLQWITQHNDIPASHQVVLRFHGTCTTTTERALSTGARISLATTRRSGDVILPFTDAYCDKLRNFLAAPDGEFAGDDQRMGRAMARVVAHELYHFLLQTQAHSKKGIAKAVHTPAALLGRSLKFENGELERIRASYSASLN